MKKKEIIIPLIMLIIIGASLTVSNVAARIRTVDFIHILGLGVALGVLIRNVMAENNFKKNN